MSMENLPEKVNLILNKLETLEQSLNEELIVIQLGNIELVDDVPGEDLNFSDFMRQNTTNLFILRQPGQRIENYILQDKKEMYREYAGYIWCKESHFKNSLSDIFNREKRTEEQKQDFYMQLDLKPLSNYEIINIANKLEIDNFRGVFTRDTLPNKINKIECGIVNLDISKNNGTHWVCYYKNNKKCYYFDSFGLDPPLELKNDLNLEIELSTFQIQKFNTHHCGYYCLLVLKLLEKYKYKEIILNILVK